MTTHQSGRAPTGSVATTAPDDMSSVAGTDSVMSTGAGQGPAGRDPGSRTARGQSENAWAGGSDDSRGLGNSATVTAVGPQSVALLTVSRGDPCISVLLPTVPSRWMVSADAGRLSSLLHQVRQQLEDRQVSSRDKLMNELERLAHVARNSRTESALGLFVNLSLARAWTLPVSVHAKAVVESTFATRDLLRALHRTPPHMVLRLDGFGARVFWVSDRVTLLDTVERIPRGTRPATSHASGADHTGPGPARGSVGVSADQEAADEDRRDFLARVDARLRRLRSEHPAPLVLAGDLELLSELKGHARWLHRLAGEVLDSEAAEPRTLFTAAALRLEDYLRGRGQQTLFALREAAVETPDRVTAGLDDCWAAVNGHTPGTLVVEHGYIHPRPSRGPGDVASHDVIDDLLELALERGNLIAFVDDGQLHEFGGIAMLRPQGSSRPGLRLRS